MARAVFVETRCNYSKTITIHECMERNKKLKNYYITVLFRNKNRITSRVPAVQRHSFSAWILDCEFSADANRNYTRPIHDRVRQVVDFLNKKTRIITLGKNPSLAIIPNTNVLYNNICL